MANELDKLDPIPETVVLRSGLQVQLESLRTRQFFKFLRIVTHGALPGMREAGLFSDMGDLDTDEFMGRLLSITLLSVPDAEDETIDFIKSMVYPVGLIERKGLNKQDLERNTILWEGLDAEMTNPDLDDLITIIEAVVKRESQDIQALGKRLASMFALAEKTGQIDTKSPSPTESTSTSSVESPGPSTSSRRSTAGRTKSSSTSRSVESVNASLLSENASTTRVGSASIG
jgi:hypothetical protein